MHIRVRRTQELRFQSADQTQRDRPRCALTFADGDEISGDHISHGKLIYRTDECFSAADDLRSSPPGCFIKGPDGGET